MQPEHSQKLAALLDESFSAELSELADDQLLMELEEWDSLSHMQFITALERSSELGRITDARSNVVISVARTLMRLTTRRPRHSDLSWDVPIGGPTMIHVRSSEPLDGSRPRPATSVVTRASRRRYPRRTFD